MSRWSMQVGSSLARAIVLGSVVALGCATASAQQNVFSRDDSGTSSWDQGSNLPWYYQTWNNIQSRPDFGGRNNVFFGHNNNLTQDVNSLNWYQLGSLTIQPSASSNRTFNSSGGAGISLTSALTNQSAGTMTFNVPFGIDSANVTFSNSGGLVSAGNSLFLNSNTLAFDGTGNFSVSGAMQGAGGKVTKNGAGTLTLSGTNTYTGNTTVAAGTLSLATAGSIDNSAVIDVQSGATLNVSAVASGFSVKSGQTLKGNGTVVGNTTVNGGANLSPGASPGRLSVTGNLTLANNATTTMEITSTSVGGFDEIDVTGALTYDGTLSIPISGTYSAGNSFDLFDFASQGGSFDAITLSGSYAGSLVNGGGGTWSNTLGGLVFTFTSSDGILSLSTAAIPEPLTAAGVVLLAGRVLGRRARTSL